MKRFSFMAALLFLGMSFGVLIETFIEDHNSFLIDGGYSVYKCREITK